MTDLVKRDLAQLEEIRACVKAARTQLRRAAVLADEIRLSEAHHQTIVGMSICDDIDAKCDERHISRSMQRDAESRPARVLPYRRRR